MTTYSKKNKINPFSRQGSNEYLVGGLLSTGLGMGMNMYNSYQQDQENKNLEREMKQREYTSSLNSMASASNQALIDDFDSKFAEGGDLNSFENGGSHEENPLGGIPQGADTEGKQNLVEEGETRSGDYIYSDRVRVTPDLISEFNLPKQTLGKTMAEASKFINEETKERPNDPISIKGRDSQLERLKMASEKTKAVQGDENSFANGGDLENKKPNWFQRNKDELLPSALRLAPVLGNYAMMTNLEKPERTGLARMTSAAGTAKHIDREAYMSPIIDQRESIIRGAANYAGGNAAAARAGILASNIGMSKAMGEAGTKADMYNIEQDFRAASSKDRAAMANLQQSNLEEDINARNLGAYESQKSALTSSLFSSMGAIGKEMLQGKAIGAAYGYTPTGKYIKKDKNTKATGGFIDTNKYKRLLNL